MKQLTNPCQNPCPDIQLVLVEYSFSYDPISYEHLCSGSCDVIFFMSSLFYNSTLCNKSNEVLINQNIILWNKL